MEEEEEILIETKQKDSKEKTNKVNEHDAGITEHNTKISTIVGVEATIISETAILPSHSQSQSQLQPVANQEQHHHHQQQQQQHFRSSTTSTSTTSGNKFDANNNTTSKKVSSSSSSSPSKRERKVYIRTDWIKMYQQLLEYKKEHGDSTKVSQYYEKYPKLCRWVKEQRNLNNNNKLWQNRRIILDSINFDWGNGAKPVGSKSVEPKTSWMEMYQRFLKYKKHHNNSNAPSLYKDDLKLKRWVAQQRTFNNNNKLLHARYSLLSSINFDWGPYTAWMETYQRLVAYKKQYRNTNVPARYKEDPQLGIWCTNQRSMYINKSLRKERVSLLDSIGFEWVGDRRCQNGDQTTWMETYQRLVAYKKQHRNTHVPLLYKEDPQLGIWAATQRKSNNSNTLLHDRRSLLDSIDFNWGKGPRGPNTDWMDMYQRLVVYKQQHQNTNVPLNYKDDPKLGKWIYTQRVNYHNKNLRKARAILLDSIDFDGRDRKRKNIKNSNTTTTGEVPVPVPPPTCTGRVVHTYHACAPNNDTTNALGSSSSSSSSCRCTSFTSQQHGPILDDCSDDNDDEGDILII